MRSPSEVPPKARGKFLFAAAGLIVLIALAAAGALKTAWAQSQATPSPEVPQWQTDAGGKMEFDVVSVKPNKSGLGPTRDTPSSSVPLDAGPAYSSHGGLFSATNFAVDDFIAFAYRMNRYQHHDLLHQLPKWAFTDRFDIQARAAGNPSKDQMRLMMQALLADRFKLAIHREMRQLPVFGLVLAKPGKMGPQLRPHPQSEGACSDTPPPVEEMGYASAPPTVSGGYPAICGLVMGLQSSVAGRGRLGASNVSMEFLADALTGGEIDRPLVDRTGLSGNVDFIVEWTPQIGPQPPGATFQPDPTGPTLVQALQEELGLKLEPQVAPVKVFVIDHVEEPSPN
jgi:uncharacterized protein (TIGR03435 family)